MIRKEFRHAVQDIFRMVIQDVFQKIIRKIFRMVFFECLMVEKLHMQKSPIPYQFEHFLVLEHRILIWRDFVSGRHGKHGIILDDIDPALQNDSNSIGFIDMLKY